MNSDLAARPRSARRLTDLPQHDVAARHRGSFRTQDRNVAFRGPAHRTADMPRWVATDAVPRTDRRRAIEPDSTQVGFVMALVYGIGLVTVLTLFL
jgi:hypothetical protein